MTQDNRSTPKTPKDCCPKKALKPPFSPQHPIPALVPEKMRQFNEIQTIIDLREMKAAIREIQLYLRENSA
jgi:hypothetical protein